MCYITKEYLIIGYNINNEIKNLNKEKLDELFSHLNNSSLDLVYDEVNKSYCYIGKIISIREPLKTSNIINMSLIRIKDAFSIVKNDIKNATGLHCEPQLIIFNHTSIEKTLLVNETI